ncbi:MAG: hypothetical protein IPP51_07640 [Bacteroidetes bacterium]|nr:hypothetical protein [Bacteroidota bacterium]
MKRIIDKKVYDTETATWIATDAFGNYDNFRSFEETLYRTANGNYFLKYRGGPLSKYAVDEGTEGKRGDSGIIVFSHDEAFEWLVSARESELAAELFPDKITEA